MKARLIEPMLEDGQYCWLIELGERLVGVHAQTGWCMRVDDRVIALDEESKFVPLGPVLDVPGVEFFAFLQRAAVAAPNWAELLLAFPKETLLKHVFHTSYSSYWPERALSWLIADQALWPRFGDELKAFSTNKVMPQGARQHAQKMLRTTENH
ncbi:hypothetical protein GIY62_17360 [Burkholderia plantarii]|uniref:hypothetical protein n=1 Tax=Burkholderia plantarii TaxID=41899 RepID=UPI00272CF770|nr:hypothetical protein [Burkholderia plantarii]WLE58853.1 hypothetical protein GIY62_17360 [Burkholderia plantarii]